VQSATQTSLRGTSPVRQGGVVDLKENFFKRFYDITNMDVETFRALLHFVSEKEIGVDAAESRFRKDIIQVLEHLGWIAKEDGKYKFVADIDVVAEELCKSKDTKLNVPFVSKVYKSTNAYMLPIPQYVLNTFNIQPRDLVVLKIQDKIVSGLVSGDKGLFYIRKKFWNLLNIEPGTEVMCILVDVYKRRERVAEKSD